MNDTHLAHKILSGIEEAHKQGKTPAFSYDRVSSKKQGEKGESLADQENRSQLYAQKNNLYVIHTFSCIESAFREGRKNFNEMLDKALEYNIENIIFKNTDRLGRNDYDWPRCKKLAKTKGLRVHLYELNMVYSKSSTAEEEMILDQSSALAVYWSNKISKSVIAAYDYKCREGVAPFNNRMYGYIYDKHQKVYVKDPNTKHIVDFLFQKILKERISIRELSKELNERGYRNILGNKWSVSTLHRMLKNPFYAGKFIRHDKLYDGIHEPYITNKQFETILKRLEIKFMGSRKRKEDFIFSNAFLKYGDYTLTGEMKKGKYIYYTNRFVNKTFREEWILNMIDGEVDKINLDENTADGLLDLLKGAMQIRTKGYAKDQSTITREINKLERENDKLIDSILQGFDQKTIQRRMTDNRKRIEHLESDRQKLRVDKDDFIMDTGNLLNQIREFPHAYRYSDPEHKGKLIKDFVQCIKVSDDAVKIIWKEPFCHIINESVLQITDALSSNSIPPEKVRKYFTILPRCDNFRTILDDTIDKLTHYYSRVA